MNKKFYITTPIYYASGSPHLGHVYCTVFCDVLARCKELIGYKVFFSTGTDEHGQKIEKKATILGLLPKDFVDNIVKEFKYMWEILGIKNSIFIRTTDSFHIESVKKIFSQMLLNEDIYFGEYDGWYCVECESFWSDTQIGTEKKCPDCCREVVKEKEKSYFFKCSKYTKTLLEFYKKNPSFCFPINRLNEMMNSFILPGLHDLSVSRIGSEWGIKIDDNSKYYIYVWFDALINYLSAVGLNRDDDLFKEFWCDPKTEIVHVVGADIARFHCIYWPMFLNSCGFRLPNHILVHGLIKIKNEKMSKSKGNSIDPLSLIERFGADTIRYFLVSEIPFGYNYDLSIERFVEKINVLPCQLGNLVNRVLSMVEQYFSNKIPDFISVSNADKEIEEKMFYIIDKYKNSIENLNISEAISSVFLFISDINKYITVTSPWVLHKEGENEKLQAVISHLSHFLYVISVLLSPILVNKYKEILKQLDVEDNVEFDSIKNFGILNGKNIKKGELLFNFKDKKDNINFLQSLIK